jgi:hypothetical protein
MCLTVAANYCRPPCVVGTPESIRSAAILPSESPRALMLDPPHGFPGSDPRCHSLAGGVPAPVSSATEGSTENSGESGRYRERAR